LPGRRARDACPIYAALAAAVASSPDLLAFLAELPEDKAPAQFIPGRGAAPRRRAATTPMHQVAGKSVRVDRFRNLGNVIDRTGDHEPSALTFPRKTRVKESTMG
jgi:hypothetical protein